MSDLVEVGQHVGDSEDTPVFSVDISKEFKRITLKWEPYDLVMCGGTLWISLEAICRISGWTRHLSGPLLATRTNDKGQKLLRIKVLFTAVNKHKQRTYLHYSEIMYFKRDTGSDFRVPIIKDIDKISEALFHNGHRINEPTIGIREQPRASTRKEELKKLIPTPPDSKYVTEEDAQDIMQYVTQDLQKGLEDLRGEVSNLSARLRKLEEASKQSVEHTVEGLKSSLEKLGFKIKIMPIGE